MSPMGRKELEGECPKAGRKGGDGVAKTSGEQELKPRATEELNNQPKGVKAEGHKDDAEISSEMRKMKERLFPTVVIFDWPPKHGSYGEPP